MKRASMAEALSNAAGHSYSRPVALAAVAAPEQRPTPVATLRAVSSAPPSRIGKKPVTGFFEPAVSRQLKRIGLDHEKTMQELIQEGLNDLFRKYGLPPIA
ncbi:hypothetical protein SAMN05421770_101669 [Granulicella rosea]|uniref:Antitoxin-like ribbon-helix-helix domain-containing protein n=1 Tax=Granulicella rosea TaxID=474952 RepID=A0A239DV62_9BACT|nr:ribbon-helix-helix domain-containing protein [Granulicella rosea]SNS36485.1 hypothetical protein SAMN05421770_101669 [Granulicella rosea]